MRAAPQLLAGKQESALGARLTDRFGQGAASARSQEELAQLLAEAAEELGFDLFALVHHAAVGTSRNDLIRIHNYPAAWEAELVEFGLAAADPVHLASTRASSGFCWSELDRMLSLGRQEREVMERARRHDIHDGFTIPANVPGEPSGSCTFAVRQARKLPIERLLCAEQIGLHAFQAARRLVNYPACARRPRLSPRERQCLRLIAAGKTDWEIAVILGISIETARQYVKRARAAYDVVSRAQLVALGLRDCLISFDDAFAPRAMQRGIGKKP